MAAWLRTQPMTAAEFFELPESDQQLELIEGEVIALPTPIPNHQRRVGRLYRLIDDLKPDGEVFIAPLEVYLDAHNVPQPDIVWVASSSRCRVTDKRLEGPPDLVVEVLSPGTELKDRRDKFNLYQRFGVREYWLVDPVENFIEVYRLQDGAFVRQGVYGPDESFESAALGGKTVSLTGIFDPQ